MTTIIGLAFPAGKRVEFGLGEKKKAPEITGISGALVGQELASRTTLTRPGNPGGAKKVVPPIRAAGGAVSLGARDGGTR